MDQRSTCPTWIAMSVFIMGYTRVSTSKSSDFPLLCRDTRQAIAALSSDPPGSATTKDEFCSIRQQNTGVPKIPHCGSTPLARSRDLIYTHWLYLSPSRALPSDIIFSPFPFSVDIFASLLPILIRSHLILIRLLIVLN